MNVNVLSNCGKVLQPGEGCLELFVYRNLLAVDVTQAKLE